MRKHWHKRKIAIALFHTAVWSLLLMLPYFLRPDIPGMRNQSISTFLSWGSIAHVLFLAAVFYFNAYWLIPRLFNVKRYWLYAVSIILILCAGAVFNVNVVKRKYFFQLPPDQIARIRMKDAFPLRDPSQAFHLRPPFFPTLFPLLFTIAASIAYRFFLDRLRFERVQQQRQTEHLKSELSFLRSQISPHFIFNILNSAVAQARTQPSQVESTLLKLSGLMRYMLYDTDDTKVMVKQELEYLESYVELQRLRFGDAVQIDFSRTASLFGYAIEPMLLIPFVENAFKHGLGKVDKPQIFISVGESNGWLTLQVKNKYDPERRSAPDKYSGIGLTNVKKRLSILYGSSYQLSVNATGDWYETTLKLPLR